MDRLQAGAVAYDREERFAGETKYPLKKMLRFALDALTGFSSAPLKLASHAGLALSIGSIVLILYIAYAWAAGQNIQGWTSLMLVVVVLGAMQMFVLALMGEYIGRLYNEAKRRPLYIVQEVAGVEHSASAARRGLVISPMQPRKATSPRQRQAPDQVTLRGEGAFERSVEQPRRKRHVGIVLAARPGDRRSATAAGKSTLLK